MKLYVRCQLCDTKNLLTEENKNKTFVCCSCGFKQLIPKEYTKVIAIQNKVNELIKKD